MTRGTAFLRLPWSLASASASASAVSAPTVSAQLGAASGFEAKSAGSVVGATGGLFGGLGVGARYRARAIVDAAVMDRRQALQLLGALPLAACDHPPKTSARRAAPLGAGHKMPVLFAAHGAPMLLEDAEWVAQLAGWAKALPKPKSILMVSAHWEERPTTLGATTPVPVIHDFSGFPTEYYQMQYSAPGAPALAARVRDVLRQNQIPFTDDAARGLDHGAYVPLMAMYPNADVPVLQLSMPGLNTQELFKLGSSLAPLRSDGVLVFGSGFLTHNMSYAGRPGTPAWAKEFDSWAENAISHLDVDALMDFQARAPAAELALPTWEHYAPLLVAAGALGGERPAVAFPIEGFWMGSFTKRSVQFG